jgi:hypothetical protein
MKKLLLFSTILMLASWANAQGVTYTVTVPSGTNACYIAGEMNNWSQQEMTKVTDTQYTLTIAGATTAHKYKYCSGPNWAYEEKQADCTSGVPNRTYSANDVVACWAAVWVPATPKVDITISVKVPASWTTPKIHFWGDQSSSWPGENMVQMGDMWMYTFNQINIINIIFNNGAGAQTANITNVTASTCYQVNENNSHQVISCDPGLPGKTYNVTVPEGTNKCYIAGDMNGWIFEEMTQVTPTTYTINIASASNAHGYKYLSGPGWAWEEVQADCSSSVANRAYAENDVVACWKAVYDPATVPQDYVYNVTVPTGTKNCYIVGNFNNWGSFTPMTKLTETTYTITINTNAPNGYKFTSGPSWDYEELQANGSAVADRNYNQENTVELWKAVFDPTTSSTNAVNNLLWVRSISSGIHVELNGAAHVAVYSTQGSLLREINASQSTQINNLSAGMYIVRVNGQSYKAIVQ